MLHIGTTSSFKEVMTKENNFTIHQRNIQKLTIEIYQIKHKIVRKLMCETLI